MYPRIEAFLQQSMHEPTAYAEAIAQLEGLFTAERRH
jgi:flagellum-specific ATP synthase